MSHYHKRLIIELAMLFAVLFMAFSAHAAAPLPPAPATGWCYDSFAAPNYNGVRACDTTPPPPSDPGAYTTLGVTWVLHGQNLTRVTDVTQLANLFGHITPTQPVQGWPYVSGTNVLFTDSTPKYLRLRFSIPLNPGAISHKIKPTSYGHSPATLRARLAVVAPGAPWPTQAGTCYKTDVPFSDQVGIEISPVPNSVKCVVQPGASYDLLIDSTGGVNSYTWN